MKISITWKVLIPVLLIIIACALVTLQVVRRSIMKETRENLLEICDGYLRKPLSEEDLMNELKRFFTTL